MSINSMLRICRFAFFKLRASAPVLCDVTAVDRGPAAHQAHISGIPMELGPSLLRSDIGERRMGFPIELETGDCVLIR